LTQQAVESGAQAIQSELQEEVFRRLLSFALETGLVEVTESGYQSRDGRLTYNKVVDTNASAILEQYAAQEMGIRIELHKKSFHRFDSSSDIRFTPSV
jgi:predicted NAD/FAD-dependent oxidoreductase